LTFSGAEVNRDVLAFDITDFLQAVVECCHESRGIEKGHASQEANDRHGRPLRARWEQPRRSRAAEKRDELAPLHVLPSDEVHNLAHQLGDEGRCASQRNRPAYVGSGSKAAVSRGPALARNVRSSLP
jgi:hypothetical protein